MESKILKSLGIDPAYIFLFLIMLIILMFLLYINVNMKYSRLKSSYNLFMRGQDGKTLEESFSARFDELDELSNIAHENKADIRILYRVLRSSYQKVGIVKYDAFGEMGGKLSFALTMLDNDNNGWILNSMHSRDGCYTYIKEIVRGESYIELSEEEAESLDQAVYQEMYDPDVQDLLMAQKPPSAEHILGTDRYGRDMFSRVLVGSTTSIYATLLLVAIITVLGTVIGIICGWCGGILDTVLMRISDLFLAFPSLVFALAVAGVLGGGIQNAIIALAVIGWPKFARLARGLTLAQKDSPYLMAVRLSGSITPKIMFKHILPNIAGPILVTSVLDIGTMMMELAGLSFLGLGVQPPMAEWGSMINDGRSMLQISPWMVLAPGLAIFITVMIFNLLGDTLRDFMDPKERAKR